MPELFTIKPLEWEWFQLPMRRGWRAPTVGDNYAEVCQFRQGSAFTLVEVENVSWTPWEWNNGYDQELRPCASPEEGKRLAEEHWREYVKQVLVPVKEED